MYVVLDLRLTKTTKKCLFDCLTLTKNTKMSGCDHLESCFHYFDSRRGFFKITFFIYDFMIYYDFK